MAGFSDTVKSMKVVWCYSMAIASRGHCGGSLLSLLCSFRSALWKERLRIEPLTIFLYYKELSNHQKVRILTLKDLIAKGAKVQGIMGAHVTPYDTLGDLW